MAPHPWILLTNDDGVDAPALGPMIECLGTIADVRVVVPDSERSWVGKAMSRFEAVTVTDSIIEDHPVSVVSGYPADCTQLGARNLFDTEPSLVVSGINIGANHGTTYLSASGTVGAAFEAAMIDIPAVAFSAVRAGDWETWSRFMASAQSRPEWHRLAEIAAEISAEVWAHGLPPSVDALSVNIPGQADRSTARRITRLADTRHGTLFTGSDGRYVHQGSVGLRATEPTASDTDLAASEAGVVSITPLRIARMAVGVDEQARVRFER